MADHVGEATEGSNESARTAQQIAEQNAETIRDLRMQYQEKGCKAQLEKE